MIVTLTDFGQSAYLGVMKGVMVGIASEARIVDLYNEVKQHSIREGAWLLKTNYHYFPQGSIFLCVVDPGVGGSRKAMVVRTEKYLFVGPDNGLMWPAIEEDGMVEAVELPTEGASRTFHGRDVFAVAAGKLESGAEFVSLGKPLEGLTTLVFSLDGRTGEVVAIDRFGNIITNIPPLEGKGEYVVSVEGFEQKLPWRETYANAEKDELFLITGSVGTLEISVREGSAAERIPAKEGNHITIR